jgi:ABC-type phosphate transport system substrate-binding protein
MAVGNNRTVVAGRTLGVACLWMVAAGCAAGDDPDPRAIAAALRSGGPSQRDLAPQLEFAGALDGNQVVAAFAAPAPAGEVRTMARAELAPLQEAAIVVGLQATHVLDRTLTEAFLATVDGITAVPTPTSDREAVEFLMLGRADFGVIGGQVSAREQQAGARQTQLGVELFALSMAPGGPVRTLTHHQVRQIFTGQLTHWQQLGLYGGKITALVPAERTLAERAAKALMPGDAFASSCVKVASEKHLVDQLLQQPGAIGVLRVTQAPREAGQQLLMIDGGQPTIEAYGFGSYPFGIPVQLVTSGHPAGLASRFLEFARTAEGRALLGRTLSLQP